MRNIMKELLINEDFGDMTLVTEDENQTRMGG